MCVKMRGEQRWDRGTEGVIMLAEIEERPTKERWRDGNEALGLQEATGQFEITGKEVGKGGGGKAGEGGSRGHPSASFTLAHMGSDRRKSTPTRTTVVRALGQTARVQVSLCHSLCDCGQVLSFSMVRLLVLE